MSDRGRDPRFGAAVLKRSFLAEGVAAEAYREIYEGTLRDLGLTDAEVQAYIEAHREEVEAACARVRRRTARGEGE